MGWWRERERVGNVGKKGCREERERERERGMNDKSLVVWTTRGFLNMISKHDKIIGHSLNYVHRWIQHDM